MAIINKMFRFVATICLLFLLLSPIAVSASEFPIPETPLDNFIPVFFFGDQYDGILTIVPIRDDIFVWSYLNKEKLLIGNLTNKSDIGNYAYSQTNKTNPHAATSAGSTNYTYDDNGNLTSDGTHTYTWDYNNRLLSSASGLTTYTYSYDHEGNRVKKVQGSNTTIYVNRYYEIDPSGKITKHIYGGDDRIALVETVSGVKTPYYVHKDHLGGSSVITDSSGNKAELVDYYPYGSTRLDEKAGFFENIHKFTGKELDGETGLYYYGQRYYDSNIGRWVSEDPAFLAVGDNDELKDITKLDLAKYLANPQLANSYSYVANNPLKFIDKEGEFLDTVIDAGFIVSDIRGIYQDIRSGNNPIMGFAALGLDVVGAITPGITGLGTGAKALMNAEKARDVIRSADKAIDATKQATTKIHGNSLNSPKPTTLYQLISKETGEHLKYGITSKENPIQRYTQKFMSDKFMNRLETGTRREMHAKESQIIKSNSRGPLQKNNH